MKKFLMKEWNYKWNSCCGEWNCTPGYEAVVQKEWKFVKGMEWRCGQMRMKQLWGGLNHGWNKSQDERDLTWKSCRMGMKQWPGRYEAVAVGDWNQCQDEWDLAWKSHQMGMKQWPSRYEVVVMGDWNQCQDEWELCNPGRLTYCAVTYGIRVQHHI